MFAKFDEIPAMTLQDIKETKRYRRTHGTVYPPQTKFGGGGGGGGGGDLNLDTLLRKLKGYLLNGLMQE